MSSSSLGNKVPYYIVFPNEPLFHISPQVFGCMCFVHDVCPSLDKLSAPSIKHILLGYSCLHKGYQCYSQDTKRYCMSASVTLSDFMNILVSWLLKLTKQ